jgi:Arc/MetJ-type ribon-helix-helix transcriptional regulator
MVRMQVQLTERQVAALRDQSRRSGVSVAALVREAVDASFERRSDADRWERALGAVGVFESGARDVSENHDREVADAIAGRLR